VRVRSSRAEVDGRRSSWSSGPGCQLQHVPEKCDICDDGGFRCIIKDGRRAKIFQACKIEIDFLAGMCCVVSWNKEEYLTVTRSSLHIALHILSGAVFQSCRPLASGLLDLWASCGCIFKAEMVEMGNNMRRHTDAFNSVHITSLHFENAET